ncbi:MAG: LysE family transporter [Bdellovibrionales bacterium]
MTHLSIYFVQWLTLIALFSIAVMSPGPDFVVVVRNSVAHSRRAGVFTALGLGLSILVHVTYTVAGIATLIAQSIMLFNVIKYAGAAYLIYLGIQALRSHGMGRATVDRALKAEKKIKPVSDAAAFGSGFLTNLLNPKATLFFLAIFSQIIKGDTPIVWMAVYGITCSVIITAWFSLVAFVLTQAKVRNAFLKATKWIDRGCGLVLMGLGIKVALSSR